MDNISLRQVGVCVDTNCGAAIFEGDAFCQVCGTRVPEQNNDEGTVCKGCFRRVKLIGKEKICPRCATNNKKLEDESISARTILYVEPPTAFASELPEWSIEPPPAAVIRKVARS